MGIWKECPDGGFHASVTGIPAVGAVGLKEEAMLYEYFSRGAGSTLVLQHALGSLMMLPNAPVPTGTYPRQSLRPPGSTFFKKVAFPTRELMDRRSAKPVGCFTQRDH